MLDHWLVSSMRGAVLLWAAMLAGCQSGSQSERDQGAPTGSEKPRADSAVARQTGSQAKAAAVTDAATNRNGDGLAGADGQADGDGQHRSDQAFTGTNLLEGVWDQIRTQAEGKPADNSYCYVCHANFQDDELSRIHSPSGIGCELCHGVSDEHSADEDGLTPPEIMWPKSWINVTCMECHSFDELERSASHGLFLAHRAPEEFCTDCHGEAHRLNVRTRVWDRKTGKLIACDGVRMMDADSPAGAAH
jgi:hypothetical protein